MSARTPSRDTITVVMERESADGRRSIATAVVSALSLEMLNGDAGSVLLRVVQGLTERLDARERSR